MGQKTNPIGLRLALNKDWASKWYAEKKEYSSFLAEDRAIRDLLRKKLSGGAVTKILIERAANRVRIKIRTARPGVVIGRRGAEIDKLKAGGATVRPPISAGSPSTKTTIMSAAMKAWTA